MRKPFLAGNWKMNTDSNSSVELAKAVAARLGADGGGKGDVAVARRLCIWPLWPRH